MEAAARTCGCKAADASRELIEDGPYSIYSTGDPNTDYNAIHRMTDLTGIKEVLYWRRYQLGIFTNHVQSYHKDYNGGATKNAVEAYLCTDGLPISLSPLYQGDEVYEDIWVNRDSRLRQTVMHPDDQAIYRYGNHDFGVTRYPRIQGMTGPGIRLLRVITLSRYTKIMLLTRLTTYRLHRQLS